ncbi:cytochrome c [Sphingomonas sp.]|uniref:c-type cytochrome n=1 Tax=Sphingomonas sp. TaxID=28214 RepID=UPI0025ECE380|nr:cytochrome c [Sphingomonas sp.]MBV9528862.1 cytochrome c [Sphingomonas sp.]
MRIALFATTTAFVLLGACGGPHANSSNTTAANTGNSASPPQVAAGSNADPDMTPVSADQAKTVMHERHEGMESIGKTTKTLKRELDSSSPDTAAVHAAAAQMADLSSQATGWFRAGTGPDVGKTGAKPEIWQNPQDFAVKVHAFQQAAKAFNVAVMSGDGPSIKTKFGELGQSCQSCHDKYRSEMHH